MMSFEKDLEKLNGLVKEIEFGNISLDDSLKLFGEAVETGKKCADALKSAKGKLELLTDELEKLDLDVEEE